MITKQRGEGAHLLDALWLRTLGDVTSLRRLGFQCRNVGQKIAEHEISEMIEYLEERKKQKTTATRKLERPKSRSRAGTRLLGHAPASK